MIKNVNTLEEYKDIDKISLLQQAGKTVQFLYAESTVGHDD
jgi:hypothetical protein